VEGPFKHLINEWRFEGLSNNQCKVSFFIDFELSSKIFNLLMNEFFDVDFKRMVSSFQNRAENIYSNQ
jgi:coenzyme Q-binding protein COQ10